MLTSRLLALAFAASVMATDAHAQAHHMMAHGGVPERIVANQHVGPYVAALWANRNVGMSSVYVVLSPDDDTAFVPPSSVRVAVVPASRRMPEQIVEAHAEPVQSGARYVSGVMFDRAERWNVRVMIDGPAGGGQLESQLDAVPDAMHGAFGVVLSSLPFLLVAGIWWRASRSRGQSR